MRPSPRFILSASLVLVCATLARAAGTVPPGYSVATQASLTGGVEHLTLTRGNPNQSVHVARIPPGAPVALAAVSSRDAIPSRVSDQELPSDMCQRVACIVGVNGDFHDNDTGEPIGGVVADGRLVRSPPTGGGEQLIVASSGKLRVGPLDWAGSVTAGDGTTIPLAGFNVDRLPGTVLYTPAWAAATPPGAQGELVLRATGPVGTLEAPTTLEIVGFRGGPGPVPAGGAVLSADGRGAPALAALWSRVRARATSPLASLALHADGGDVAVSIGIHPVLLRDGRPVFPATGSAFATTKNPRTLVGWNDAGEVFLVTVDGRRDDADGMTLAGAADLLLALGATDGANFDGGGGTTFVAEGAVANLPSDPTNPGPPSMPGGHVVAPGHVERLAPNALVVVSRPTPPPTTTPATGSDPGTPPGQDPSADPGATTSTPAPGDDSGDVGVSTGERPRADPLGIVASAPDADSRVLSLLHGPSRGRHTRPEKDHRATRDPATGSDANLDGIIPRLPQLGGVTDRGQSALGPDIGGHSSPPPLLPVLAGLLVAGTGGAALYLVPRLGRRRRRARAALWL